MLTKTQLRILDAFRRYPERKLTFKELKKESSQKSQNIVQIAIKAFLEEGIVVRHVVADVASYSVNLKSGLAIGYLCLNEELDLAKSQGIPKGVLDGIKERVAKSTPFFILLAFGSFAEGKATKKSDLDIAIIVDTERARKDTLPIMETIKRREIMAIDYHIFTTREFKEMLTAESENLGKEIYRKHMICYGAIQYYQIIGDVFNEKRI